MARRGAVRGIVAVIAAMAILDCGGKSPSAPGAGASALLGLTANPTDATFPDSLLSAFQTAYAVGSRVMQNGELWSELESSPGVIDASTVRLKFAVFHSLGFSNYYNLRVVDTNQRGVPADLATAAWDNPALIARVEAVVDTLLEIAAVYPLLAFSLGNEVDAYFAGRPAELPAFRALLQRVRGRVRARFPSLPVGCCTISPVQNPGAWVGDTLNAATDLVIYTYYPFVPASDFQHRPTSTFEPDLAAMLARAGNRPLAMQEVGYSSSPGNGSSPAAQADAVRRFRAWAAAQPRSRVLFANWFLMTDWSSATVNQLTAYYGGTSPGFAAYLGNIGLRDSSGAAKPAWTAWRSP